MDPRYHTVIKEFYAVLFTKRLYSVTLKVVLCFLHNNRGLHVMFKFIIATKYIYLKQWSISSLLFNIILNYTSSYKVMVNPTKK